MESIKQILCLCEQREEHFTNWNSNKMRSEYKSSWYRSLGKRIGKNKTYKRNDDEQNWYPGSVTWSFLTHKLSYREVCSENKINDFNCRNWGPWWCYDIDSQYVLRALLRFK